LQRQKRTKQKGPRAAQPARPVPPRQPGPSAQDSQPGPSTQDSQPGPSTQDSQPGPSAQDSQPGPSTQDSQLYTEEQRLRFRDLFRFWLRFLYFLSQTKDPSRCAISRTEISVRMGAYLEELKQLYPDLRSCGPRPKGQDRHGQKQLARARRLLRLPLPAELQENGRLIGAFARIMETRLKIRAHLSEITALADTLDREGDPIHLAASREAFKALPLLQEKLQAAAAAKRTGGDEKGTVPGGEGISC
jgi:hypothetical protein